MISDDYPFGVSSRGVIDKQGCGSGELGSLGWAIVGIRKRKVCMGMTVNELEVVRS